MHKNLSQQELETWRGFRFMVEETSLSVSRALASETGLSGGQFGILSLLVNAPLQSMRQQEMADAMRWDRTRLSHVVTRMEERGWLKREKVDRGVTLVLLAEDGKRHQHQAAPILARIVKHRFFSRLTSEQLNSLQEIRRALASECVDEGEHSNPGMDES